MGLCRGVASQRHEAHILRMCLEAAWLRPGASAVSFDRRQAVWVCVCACSHLLALRRRQCCCDGWKLERECRKRIRQEGPLTDPRLTALLTTPSVAEEIADPGLDPQDSRNRSLHIIVWDTPHGSQEQHVRDALLRNAHSRVGVYLFSYRRGRQEGFPNEGSPKGDKAYVGSPLDDPARRSRIHRSLTPTPNLVVLLGCCYSWYTALRDPAHTALSVVVV